MVGSMVKSVYESNKPSSVLLASIITSIVLVIFFLFGAISTNAIRGERAYTQVDMVAGSIFVFVITMIISLSLWPKIMDWLDSSSENDKIFK